jgi:hypothetical protein
VSDNPTRVTGAPILLGGGPDDIELDARDGHLTIILATGISIGLDFADQAVVDKLATVTAEAAAVQRARSLRRVA